MTTYRNAEALVEALIARYRGLRSYTEVGVVRPVHADEPLSTWFETDYASPDMFRFQFVRPDPHPRLRWRLTKYIAGASSDGAYFYTEERGGSRRVEREASLEMAVAGATGISEGTAHTIGSLLMDRVGGFSFDMLNRIRFREIRCFDGVFCHCVSGVHPRGGRFTLLVSVQDLLLRKLIHHKTRREEVRFNIRTDIAIPEERFAIPAA